MLNSALADQTAEALAKKIREGKGDDTAHIRDAYRRVYFRSTSQPELDRVLTYLKTSEEKADQSLTSEARQLRSWRGLCRVLLASNEFVFVE